MQTDPQTADAAIEEYAVLGGPTDEALQSVVELAALVCDVPHAAINLITRDHQHQVAAVGIDPSVCAREDSMCAAVLHEPAPVVTPDARQDSRFATNPFVTGEIGTVRFYASAPLVTPGGEAIGRLCVFDDLPHDLTAQRAHMLAELARRVVDVLELRLRTRQLEQSRDELRRSNELLSLFAGQVSHDLRSPLTAIMANAELLTLEPVVQEDEGVAALADATLAAGRRMAAMIQAILDFTVVGARLDMTDLDLGDLLTDVLTDLDPIVEERRARVSSGELPQVRGDRQQLYAVLLNLVSNAVKFTPATTRPVVEVRAVREDGRWRIEVSDNGRGIPAEQREGLFDLYSRGAGSGGVEGTGIGLATARRAVEAHGGSIGIEDAPGGGTTVWFTVPD
ncbi:GAF domain-containing sensor histidine kinase [Nocardioides marmoribigeumensis]|uniref:Sensor-like histidine kinase SenX3 n=1 Tax=Nocardioides marmoribigeumensis TaxID=433649 RepID=A0ABU2BVY5_9ACTN|nr:GAF domain-containing sensor histidine kinase [Nocardioides marmoribigeumensis]MDR7362174.1 signal transduction histidine kinase [Nocardioides marmoribigeumensis]